MGLELYEVRLVVLDVLSELLCRVLLGEGVGVVAVGQQHHFDVHAVLEEHVRTSQCRLDAGGVAVVEQYDVLREAVQYAYLVLGECRAGVGHYVLYATLVHGDDVGVALHHVDAILLGYGFLSLEYAVQLVVLVVDDGVGRVDVLLVYALGARVEHTSAEGYHLAADTYPGEHGTAGEAVYEVAVVAGVAEARLQQKFLLVALAQCFARECLAVVEAEAQTELLYDVVAHAALAEVLHTDGAAVHVVLQYVVEVVGGPLVDDEHGLALGVLLLLLVGELALLYLYVVAVGQPAQGVGVGQLLVLHDEADAVAAFSAYEAVARAARGRHVERRRMVVVERAQPTVVRAHSF